MNELTINNSLLIGNVKRHLDFCERACGALVLVSSLLPTRFTDLKAEYKNREAPHFSVFTLLRIKF